MKAAQQGRNSKYSAMFQSTNGQMIDRVQGILDTCVASDRALDVTLVELSPNRDVAKISMSTRGRSATRFVLERAVGRPR